MHPDLGGEDFDELLLARVEALARDCDPDTWDLSFSGQGQKARREHWRLR